MNQLFSSENIALVSFALLAIGFLKFILYYKAFGIPIIDYVDPSEIVTLFADNIATASLVTVLLVVPYAKLTNASLLINSGSFFSRLQYYCVSLLPVMVVSIVLLIIVISILWKRSKIYNFELISYVLSWPLIIIAIPIVVMELRTTLEFNISPQVTVAITLIISFGFLVMLATYNEIKKVKKFGLYKNIIVKFAASEVMSNTDEYFIGKTKSFVFFYSSVNKTATAYAASDLKSISYL